MRFTQVVVLALAILPLPQASRGRGGGALPISSDGPYGALSYRFIGPPVMALTREFKELVVERARRDPGFRKALLCEAVNVCLEGDLAAGKIVLRDLVNATIGLEGLGRRLGIPSKSLHRMLSPNGNPSSQNFFAIIGALTTETDVRLSVAAGRPASRRRVRR